MPTRRTVTALAVNPVTPTILYAGLDGRYYAGIGDAQLVWRTMMGDTWFGVLYRKRPSPAAFAPCWWIAALKPSTSLWERRTMPRRHSGFPLPLSDGGHSWQRADSGLPNDYAYDLAARPDGSAIYVGSRQGIYVSTDLALPGPLLDRTLPSMSPITAATALSTYGCFGHDTLRQRARRSGIRVR